MKSSSWKIIVEFVGVSAIVASLLFVGLQMRQAQEIALGDGDLALLSSRIEINSAMNEHARIWVRGNSGEVLSEEERLIFENLVSSENELAFFASLQLLRLGSSDAARTVRHDFAAFLHRNPGARIVWVEDQKNRLNYRRKISPADTNDSPYTNTVLSSLAKLDRARD
jgi:hypothetical protein